jgi:hypothetical protein
VTSLTTFFVGAQMTWKPLTSGVAIPVQHFLGRPEAKFPQDRQEEQNALDA